MKTLKQVKSLVEEGKKLHSLLQDVDITSFDKLEYTTRLNIVRVELDAIKAELFVLEEVK